MLRTLAAALILVTAPALEATAGPAAGVAAPEDIPHAFGRSWAASDAASLGALLSDDVGFITVGGAWLQGRRDFVLYHQRLLSGRFKGSTNTPLETRVQRVRPDLAIIRWSWRIEGDRNPDGTARQPRFGLMSMMAERHRGRWLVIASQNTNAGPGTAPEFAGIDLPIKLPPNLP